jgi:hypothetical protein
MNIEEDRPEPMSLADVARSAGVDVCDLRIALCESHPDASPSEVIERAREVRSRGHHCRHLLALPA